MSLITRSRGMRIAGFVATAAVAILVLSSCSGAISGRLFRSHGSGVSAIGDGAHSNQSDDTDGTTIASLRPHATAASAAYFDQRVHWKACHHDLECATVNVPINWANVTRASVSIALVDHPATGSSVGDLLVNPGGPGGSGVELVEDGVEGAVDSRIEQDYDVIGFDPRGVGASDPVRCYDDAATDKYLYAIDPGAVGSAVWIAAEKQKAKDLAAACEKNTGPVFAHIDSISVAEDMDVIRSALGESTLNYLGYSYGTYLGTLYAGLFPNRVGKFVLDGADDPWGDGSDSGDGDSGSSDDSNDFSVSPDADGDVGQALGFEDSLYDYLKACVAGKSDAVGHQTCPFSTSLASAKSRVEAFFSQVSAHPLVAKDGRELGGATLATAIDESLYDPTDWPDLTRMFIQLEKGNPADAFEFADEYNDREPDGSYDDNGDFANLAIGCLEDGHDVDLRFDRREATELTKVAPILGIYSAYGDLPCSGWKYGPTPFPNPVHAQGTGPILVVGTTGDPATPYSEAEDLATLLDNGHLITFHGEGHTAYDRGDNCIDSTVDDYLVGGTVPATDPQCH